MTCTHIVPYEDSDQTARMYWLICVFAGATFSFVGNAVFWLIIQNGRLKFRSYMAIF